MKLKTIGMFRGSAKGYLVLRVVDSEVRTEDLRVLIGTSDGGELPCAVYPLREGVQSDVLEVALAFPLFDSRSIRLSLLNMTNGGAEVELGAVSIARRELKWRSRFMHRVHPDLRERVLRAEAASFVARRGTVEIAQVFDGGGRLVYRVWVHERKLDGRSLMLRDGRGRTLAFDGRVTEESGRVDSGEEFCVVSFFLDESCAMFSFAVSGGGFDAIDGQKRSEMIKARDSLMVNPAIDERYPAEAGSVASEWADFIASRGALVKGGVTFSVITPLFRTPRPYLREMIDSVVGQSYASWELVLVNASPEDDGIKAVLDEYHDDRIRVIELEGNRGIARNTNAGIAAAAGEYLVFLDHDDMLAPTLLEEYACAIEKNAGIDLLYCDEDSFSSIDGRRFSPLFKPDLNKTLLYSHNYIVHCLAVSKRALEKVDLSSDAVDGAQDYDLTLKVLERSGKCKHIPKVLYHWRVHSGSTNGGAVESKPYVIEAGRRALSGSFSRRGVVSRVEPTEISCVYRIDMGGAERGSLAVVLVYSDSGQAERFLESMTAVLTDADRLVVVGKEAEDLMSRKCAALPSEFAQAIEWNAPYDYAAMVNEAVKSSSEDFVFVCREGIRDRGSSHLANLMGWLAQGEAGIVAPKLAYPDGLVQHAGLCVRGDGSFGYLNQNFTTDMGGGYLGTAECCCAYSAVAPDAILFRRDTFLETGGLSESYSNPVAAVADLCFKVRDGGGSVVVVPESLFVNHAHVIRADREEPSLSSSDPGIVELWKRWGSAYRRDVLFNPNVSIDASYFQLKAIG